MNTLNSIIIEGKIKYFEEVGDSSCFEIEAERNYKTKDGEYKTETSIFPIEVTSNMAIHIRADNFTLERGIRVVGRLKQKKWTDSNGIKCSQIVIIAEHIEFKPMPRTK